MSNREVHGQEKQVDRGNTRNHPPFSFIFPIFQMFIHFTHLPIKIKNNTALMEKLLQTRKVLIRGAVPPSFCSGSVWSGASEPWASGQPLLHLLLVGWAEMQPKGLLLPPCSLSEPHLLICEMSMIIQVLPASQSFTKGT